MEPLISTDGLCKYYCRPSEVKAVDMCSTLKSTRSPVKKITAQAEAGTLEEALTAIAAGVEEKGLSAWRNQKGDGA